MGTVASDPFTMTMRLCDDEGMCSHEPIKGEDTTHESYLDRLNQLRWLTHGQRGGRVEPVTEPFECTGSAHQAGEHIRCTSPAHKPFDRWDDGTVVLTSDVAVQRVEDIEEKRRLRRDVERLTGEAERLHAEVGGLRQRIRFHRDGPWEDFEERDEWLWRVLRDPDEEASDG